MPVSSTARVRKFRERQDEGKIVLVLYVCEETVMSVLSDMGILREDADYTHGDVAAGVTRLIKELARERH